MAYLHKNDHGHVKKYWICQILSNTHLHVHIVHSNIDIHSVQAVCEHT
jgi:hypothetical protein